MTNSFWSILLESIRMLNLYFNFQVSILRGRRESSSGGEWDLDNWFKVQWHASCNSVHSDNSLVTAIKLESSKSISNIYIFLKRIYFVDLIFTKRKQEQRKFTSYETVHTQNKYRIECKYLEICIVNEVQTLWFPRPLFYFRSLSVIVTFLKGLWIGS